MSNGKLLRLINEYGNVKWDEGEASGTRNVNTSIECCNKAEEIYMKILEVLVAKY